MLFSFKYFLLKASMPRAVQKSPQPLGLLSLSARAQEPG